MVNDYKSISLHDYIKFLKLYFNKSKGLVGGMNAALSQRIIKTIKKNEIRESFNLSSSVKNLIDEVVIYMIEERTQPIAEAKKKNNQEQILWKRDPRNCSSTRKIEFYL